ncbi:hypothetical protein Tco_0228487 [Tanacetum coccineum]
MKGEAMNSPGSYEHYKSVGAEVEYLEPGFELQGAKMVEMGHLLELIGAKDSCLIWVIFKIEEVKEAHESDVRHLEGLVDEVLKLWSELYKLGIAIDMKLDHLLERTQEQLDLSPFEGTQSWVVLKLKVNDKQFVEQMRFDDSNETGIHVMVEQMND